jgi:hypothetical protein
VVGEGRGLRRWEEVGGKKARGKKAVEAEKRENGLLTLLRVPRLESDPAKGQ